MSASFQLTFATVGGKDYTLTISDCNPLLPISTVENAINNIVESGALVTPYGKPTAFKKAMLYETTTETFDVKAGS